MNVSSTCPVSLGCSTSVLILGVIAGVYTVLNLVLLSCIIWCACCYGKRKSQVRPLSPNNDDSSPGQSYPLPEREIRSLRFSAQREARRLKTISESTVVATGNDCITVKSFQGQNSPFTGRHSDINGGLSAWEEEKEETDSGCQGDNPSTGSTSSDDKVFTSTPPLQGKTYSPDSPKQSPWNYEQRKLAARKWRAQRTESTKMLLGSSVSSDISDPVKESISSSLMSLPTSELSGSSQLRVLTRHAGSRKKRRTESMRSLVSNIEDYGRNCSTLPRPSRLPPLVNSRPLSSQAMTPLQPLAENSTLNTESVLNLSRVETPQLTPKNRSSVISETHSETSTLSRLSLHLADDIKLDDRFRSVV